MHVRTFSNACISSTFMFRALPDKILAKRAMAGCVTLALITLVHMTKMRTGNRVIYIPQKMHVYLKTFRQSRREPGEPCHPYACLSN